MATQVHGMYDSVHQAGLNDPGLTPMERLRLFQLGQELEQVNETQIYEAMDALDREDPQSGLRKVHALMMAIHEVLTDIGISQTGNYTDMREQQATAYARQKRDYKKKAYLSLIGVAGGALMIVSAFKVSDGVKKAMEALSKVPQPVSSTLTTIKEGDIQGPNTHYIRKVESMMEEQRTEHQRSENADQKVHDATQQMKQLLSRLSSSCIGATQ